MKTTLACRFPSWWKNSRQKFKYNNFNEIKKMFFIIFHGLSMKQIKRFFGRWESDINNLIKLKQ